MKRNLPRIDENAFYAAATQRHNNGELQEAKNLYRAILTQNSKHAGAIAGLGTMAMQVENYEKAIDFLRQAIKIGPATPTMYINLGAAYRNTEEYDKAITVYDRAIKIDQNNSAAFYNKGRALQEQKSYVEARTCYERALEISDTDADAWVNLGTTQMETEDRDLALYSFERAARLDPTIGAPYSNTAAILFDKALYEIAIVLINKAMELEPDNTKFRHEFSTFMLISGDLERAWVDFDLRFTELEKSAGVRRTEPPPYWNGEDLDGKKILVWTEQGFGEEFIASTTIPDLIETGAECILECSPRLIPVFERAFPDVKVTSWVDHKSIISEADPPFDYQYPALSLLKIFRPTLDSIVPQRTPIQPDQDLVEEFRNRYKKLAQGRRVVGLTWRSKNETFGEQKSIPLTAFEPILKTENVLFVNLQYGDCVDEIRDANERFGIDIFFDEEVDPFGELQPVLAQIAAMDMVISISNSNAHFAGSMNVPTWIMVPKGRGHFWFWFMDREDSPWYPTLRIFRQTSVSTEEESSWPEVIETVASELSDWVSGSEP